MPKEEMSMEASSKELDDCYNCSWHFTCFLPKVVIPMQDSVMFFISFFFCFLDVRQQVITWLLSLICLLFVVIIT